MLVYIAEREYYIVSSEDWLNLLIEPKLFGVTKHSMASFSSVKTHPQWIWFKYSRGQPNTV